MVVWASNEERIPQNWSAGASYNNKTTFNVDFLKTMRMQLACFCTRYDNFAWRGG